MSEDNSLYFINFYNIYSKNLFKEKYAVWKCISRTNIYIKAIKKMLTFEFHFADIVNIFEEDETNENCGSFNTKEEYIEFVNDSFYMEDIIKTPPNAFLSPAYGLIIDEDEVKYYIKDFSRQNKYLHAKVYDTETGEELPTYYFFLYNTNFDFREHFSYNVPTDICEITPLFFERNIEDYIKLFKRNKQEVIMDTSKMGVYFNFLGNMVSKYLTQKEIDVEKINSFIDDVKKTKEKYLKHFIIYTLNELVIDLKKDRLFKQCPNCLHFFEYKENKQHCSKECQLKAKSKRYYSKNKNTIKKNRILNTK